jgi:hypothetical protein
MDKNERRTFNRIKVEGAIVKYKLTNGFNVLKNYSNASEIINLSKSGIAFHIPHVVKHGTPISLKISLPDGSDFDLKGKIRWQRNTNGHNLQTIGVLFNPFGSHKEYNSMKALEYLRSMKEQAISHPNSE